MERKLVKAGTYKLVDNVDNVDNFGDNSVYSVCKAWGNCGEIWIFMWKPEILWIFYPHFGRFCGFLLGFSLFFPAFSCFAVLLFLFYRHIQFQEINVAVFS